MPEPLCLKSPAATARTVRTRPSRSACRRSCSLRPSTASARRWSSSPPPSDSAMPSSTRSVDEASATKRLQRLETAV